jgi:hypothetical protein
LMVLRALEQKALEKTGPYGTVLAWRPSSSGGPMLSGASCRR